MTATANYEFLIGLLVAILVLELAARRLRLPPAAAFIIGGIALALVPGIPDLVIDPDLVLVVFLPPLLMSGAFLTAWREFRDNISGILLLAVGAVAFTTLAVGLAAKLMVPALPWAVCFALGAIVSPPDAVAAGAVLERLSLPARLNALLEGESLLNDTSGLVLFRFALAAALTGTFSTWEAAAAFGLLTVGGVLVGLGVGYGGLALIRRLRDSDLAITATLLLTALAYIGGERLHVSGVLATVTCGLVVGWHQHTIFSATMRVRSLAFWGVLTFLLESLLFILIGLSLRGVLARLSAGGHAWREVVPTVAVVVAAVMLSRFVWLLGSDLGRRVARRLGWNDGVEPSLAVAVVLGWAGMRGVVTLAAALSLPLDLPGRDLVLACAFASILVTVLVQGTTLGPLIGLLRVAGTDELEHQRDAADLAWSNMTRAQHEAVKALSRQVNGEERHPRLLEQYAYRAKVAAIYRDDRATYEPGKIAHFETVVAIVSAGRAEALRMHRAGEIHDRVLREMEYELDLQQMVAESNL